jgi:hypothetical protein
VDRAHRGLTARDQKPDKLGAQRTGQTRKLGETRSAAEGGTDFPLALPDDGFSVPVE